MDTPTTPPSSPTPKTPLTLVSSTALPPSAQEIQEAHALAREEDRRTEALALSEPGRLCEATSKRSGAPCKRYARPGMRVCIIHGGGAPSSIEAAVQRLALARDMALEAFMERIGEDEVDSAVMLQAVVKLGQQIELLEGRATSRSESYTEQRSYEVRARLEGALDQLAERRQRRLGDGDDT